MAPVREMPALRMNMASTVMVAELLNPEIPSSGVTSPSTISKTMTLNAVISAGSHSPTKQIKVKITTPMVRSIAISQQQSFTKIEEA